MLYVKNIMSSPKVFVSHASEDKDRFVNEFAGRLRKSGVDAWLDKWEMLPGDSLVDKIFEEGLKEAEAVVIVLSKYSVSKPWVREELNSSIVSKLQKGTRVIPIVLDECEVPESLKSTLWESIHDTTNYDSGFERVLASILGKSLKPELGTLPEYTSTVLNNIDGLEEIDNLVLKMSSEYLLMNPDCPIDPKDVFDLNSSKSPPKQEVLDSIEVLEDEGYFTVSRTMGGGPDHWGCHYRVTLYGFEEYCKAYVENYGQILDQCAGLIVNNEARTNYELRDSLGISLMVVNHVIRLLENNGYIKVSEELSERISIYDVSAKLRRALR